MHYLINLKVIHTTTICLCKTPAKYNKDNKNAPSKRIFLIRN